MERERKEKEEREKKNKKKIYRNQELVSESAKWTDPLFKPERNSLCPCNDEEEWLPPSIMTVSDLKGWEDYIWARPEEIFDTQDYDVFHNGATCDDIIQGSLGDCYFLSVLASL